MNLTDPLHVPIKRKRDGAREIELCIPALIKWVSGTLAVVVPGGIGWAIMLMFDLQSGQAAQTANTERILDRMDRMESRIERLDDKIDRKADK